MDASDKPAKQSKSKSKAAARAKAAAEKAAPAVEQEVLTPQHADRKAQQKQVKAVQKRNKIVDKWFELSDGHKLIFARQRESGSVARVYIGSTKTKGPEGDSIRKHVIKLQETNKLKHRIIDNTSKMPRNEAWDALIEATKGE